MINKMGKRFFSMLSLSMFCEIAMAQTVSVENVEALPGETAEFSLSLSGGKANSYTALSFDVQFPAEGFTTTGAYTVSESWEGTMAVVGEVDESGLATIPFASSNAIAGTDVTNLVSISFKIDSNTPIGVYQVTLKNVLFEYGIAEKDYAPDVTFSVNVVNEILLDETSVVMPKGHSTANVRVRRTIKAGEWSTICLPFALTEAQVKAAFGNDVLLGDFNDYVFDDVAGAISVNFQSVKAIEANHPYIIKVNTPISEFTADGVDIDPQEAIVDFDTSRRKNQPRQFIGTYVANTVLDWGMLFLSDNQFWYSTGSTMMKGFRGYFNLIDLIPDFENNYESRVSMVFDDGSAAGIHQWMNADGHGAVVYDLQGRRVDEPKAKGIYIVNGKKVKK